MMLLPQWGHQHRMQERESTCRGEGRQLFSLVVLYKVLHVAQHLRDKVESTACVDALPGRQANSNSAP